MEKVVSLEWRKDVSLALLLLLLLLLLLSSCKTKKIATEQITERGTSLHTAYDSLSHSSRLTFDRLIFEAFEPQRDTTTNSNDRNLAPRQRVTIYGGAVDNDVVRIESTMSDSTAQREQHTSRQTIRADPIAFPIKHFIVVIVFVLLISYRLIRKR